jgi:hypothetical protein
MSTTSTEWSQNIPNILKVFQMALKYINIYQSEALKFFPNWDFWFENKPSGNPAYILYVCISEFVKLFSQKRWPACRKHGNVHLLFYFFISSTFLFFYFIYFFIFFISSTFCIFCDEKKYLSFFLFFWPVVPPEGKLEVHFDQCARRITTRVARFFLLQHNKTRKIYQVTKNRQMGIKCTKWHKMYQII